uniref:glycosyltransferase family 2 protein n=1 Tax=uncultured Polaribacter sp. TaxID=174711 RepID=UPI0026028583|nr:glycosyltransferase [uncultured Polaribacter sp.]
MKLSILIPTYNRAEFLIKNLNILASFIKDTNHLNLIEIVIGNNRSTDNTDNLVNKFILDNELININYFLNKNNIGLEKNALTVLDKANSKFVMYLGDDDYLDFGYFEKILHSLDNISNLSCIIPNYIPITKEGAILGNGRDDNETTVISNKGFLNCLNNSWRGHQLSGLVFKREGLLEAYKKHNISNIYPFIFFVSYSCLNGKTLHIIEYPVQVTQPGQENKNWGYGNDGLITEIFDNYIKLPINNYKKTRLQLRQYNKQSWRLRMYYHKNKKDFLNAFFNIWLNKNGTFLFKILFPIYIFYIFLYFKIKSF